MPPKPDAIDLDAKVQLLETLKTLTVPKPVQTLGSGGFGDCILAKYLHHSNKAQDKFVAVKVSKWATKNPGESIDMTRHEAHILQQLSHRNVIGFIDHGEVPQTGHNSEFYVYMILELINQGSLKDFLTQKTEPFSKINMMYQIFTGLQYIHSKKIFHRDVKPENILVHKDAIEGYVLKLADFGLAKTGNQLSNHSCGSRGYMPPELFSKARPYDNEKVDCFSAGMTCVQFFSHKGRLPFSDIPPRAIWLENHGWEKLCGDDQRMKDFFKMALAPQEQRECTAHLQQRVKEMMELEEI